MPAIDNCEPMIRNALLKEGWTVERSPFFLRSGIFTLFADIRMRKEAHKGNGTGRSIIIVEVKCFSDLKMFQDELYRAVGQYLIYQHAVSAEGILGDVFLAIPTTAYVRIFSESLLQGIIKQVRMKLIVVDLEREEVNQWID
jgi:XisH protein